MALFDNLKSRFFGAFDPVFWPEVGFRLRRFVSETLPHIGRRLWADIRDPRGTVRRGLVELTNMQLTIKRLGTIALLAMTLSMLVIYRSVVVDFLTLDATATRFQKSESMTPACPIPNDPCWSIDTEANQYWNYDFVGPFYMFKHDAGNVANDASLLKQGDVVVVHSVFFRFNWKSWFANVVSLEKFDSMPAAMANAAFWVVFYTLLKIGVIGIILKSFDILFRAVRMRWLWKPFIGLFVLPWRSLKATFLALPLVEEEPNYDAACRILERAGYTVTPPATAEDPVEPTPTGPARPPVGVPADEAKPDPDSDEPFA